MIIRNKTVKDLRFLINSEKAHGNIIVEAHNGVFHTRHDPKELTVQEIM